MAGCVSACGYIRVHVVVIAVVIMAMHLTHRLVDCLVGGGNVAVSAVAVVAIVVVSETVTVCVCFCC